jgi:ABC-type transport system involved in cytochrome c biogenesis ATPase subunit
MRLQRFEVQGYKNLRQRVVLEDLGAINVIHGENNVGKSNLLQAIGLFFRVLGHLHDTNASLPTRTAWSCKVADWNATGFPSTEIFDLEAPEAPRPIELLAHVSVEAEESSALPHPESVQSVEIEMRIERFVDSIQVWVPRVLLDERNAEEEWKRLALLLSRRHLPQTQVSTPRFALLGTDRRLWDERGDENRDLVPASLLLQLYDAKEAFDSARYRRWELFTKMMARFEDMLGEGSFVAVYDRRVNRANLAWQTKHARIPVALLGSGVQQIIAVVARLLMSDATIVAIEEPELNLRFRLQRRLHEIFEEIVNEDVGLRQIFVTSHSPAFESGQFFYGMSATPDGPVIERKPAEGASIYTEHALGTNVEAYLHARDGVPAYVSSDGVVQLSPRIRAELGIERGGGVVMWKRSDHPYVEMLTDEQFLEDMRSHRRGEEEKGEGDDRG